MGQYKKHEVGGPIFSALARGDIDLGGTSSTITPSRMLGGSVVSQYWPFR